MKTTSLLTAAVLGLGAVAQATADESLLPPRAQALFPKMANAEMRAPVRQAGSTSTYLGTATKALAARHTTVIAGPVETQVASQNRMIYTGKWPWENRPTFEIAPFKGTGKECGPECTMPCCEKK
jgi:hypothetical protein